MKLASLELYPDVAPTLSALARRGIPLAVCSNLASPYGIVLERLLGNYEFIWFLSYQLGCIKMPQIYQAITKLVQLLGGLSVRKYHELKRNVLGGHGIKLNRDCQERISLLLSIYKNLSIIAPEGRIDFAYSWFNRPNDHQIFSGRSIKEYLLERKSVAALYTIQRYLEKSAN